MVGARRRSRSDVLGWTGCGLAAADECGCAHTFHAAKRFLLHPYGSSRGASAWRRDRSGICDGKGDAASLKRVQLRTVIVVRDVLARDGWTVALSVFVALVV